MRRKGKKRGDTNERLDGRCEGQRMTGLNMRVNARTPIPPANAQTPPYSSPLSWSSAKNKNWPTSLEMCLRSPVRPMQVSFISFDPTPPTDN